MYTLAGKLGLLLLLPIGTALLVRACNTEQTLALLLTTVAGTLPACILLFIEWRNGQRTAERARQFMQRLIDVIPQPVYVKDAQGIYRMVNTSFVEERGVPADQIIGISSYSLSPNIEATQTQILEDAAALWDEQIEIEKHDTRDGKDRYQLIMKGACLNTEGQKVIVGTNFNLTPWRMAEQQLQQALEREIALRKRSQNFIQQLIDLIPDPVYLKNADSRYLMVNEALAKERGLPKQTLVGMTSLELAPNSETAADSTREDHAVITGEDITKEQHTTLPLTGEECYRVVIKRRCINVDGEPVIFGLHHYITRWKIEALEFQNLSWKDPLTGIANRRHFTEEAGKAVALAERSKMPLVLAMLDLDHFKRVNDRYGHPVGDEVLVEMVRRCLICLRNSDTMGRWGGEEFIVLFPLTSLDAGLQACERLRAAMADTAFETSAGQLAITLSCGLAERKPGEKLELLIERADAALYEAKHRGRNRVCSSYQGK